VPPSEVARRTGRSRERARLAASQNFALDQQFAIFYLYARFLQQSPHEASRGASKMPEMRARAVSERTISADARPPKAAQRIHHNGLPLPFRRLTDSALNEWHANAFHHRVVLDNQLQQHSMKLYVVLCRLTSDSRLFGRPMRHTVKQSRYILFWVMKCGTISCLDEWKGARLTIPHVAAVPATESLDLVESWAVAQGSNGDSVDFFVALMAIIFSKWAVFRQAARPTGRSFAPFEKPRIGGGCNGE